VEDTAQNIFGCVLYSDIRLLHPQLFSIAGPSPRRLPVFRRSSLVGLLTASSAATARFTAPCQWRAESTACAAATAPPPLPTSQSRRLLLMPKLQFRALGMGLCFETRLFF
jgi:hypothetical protein